MVQQGIISLGEAFVDFISIDRSNTKYNQYLGGATINLAVGARRLGVPVYYLCKLGTDKLSEFAEQELKKEKVSLEYSVQSTSKKICGVYVHLNEEGDRYFHSYLNPTADEVLTADELKPEVFQYAKMFYFASGTLFHEKEKETTERALNYAKDANHIVAFDANIRLKRWESEDHCRQTVLSFMKKADIVKLAEDELHFLTETDSLDTGLEKLARENIPYLFVTLGSEGGCAVMNGNKVFVPASPVKAIDTTGAGDAFMAAVLYCFHDYGLPVNKSQIVEYLEFANLVGAAVTTEIGALTSTIDIEELKEQFQKKQKQ
ncbi:carbohydrate kinase family protein [Neobacillus kokaensis]|uniref:Fructokinase n=1 Tax=Neobacillus kokaensis TaxID=2759023 RepID=A0ABQ3N4J8_9BACI|nr:carbohydrate kinase [Neobacillus kokaensis]GHH98986.1 fructokinase [Neobacillus kokaensis]